VVGNSSENTYHYECYEVDKLTGKDTACSIFQVDWQDLRNSIQFETFLGLKELYKTTTGNGESESHAIEITTNIRTKKVTYVFEDTIPVPEFKVLDSSIWVLKTKLFK
jgi:hypothetical protein